MRTTFVAATLALAVTGAALAAGVTPAVDLDDKAVLAAIEHSRPEHYRRITAILDTAGSLPCENGRFTRAMEVAFDARDGHCQLILRTSYPAKRTLSFKLDQTTYMATVRVKDDSKLIPAR